MATWFVTKRARALTILTFVAGLASVIYIPLIAWLIGRLGWRGALIALAAILAVATIPPHALLLRRRPQDLGLLPDGAVGEVAVGARPGAEDPEDNSARREDSASGGGFPEDEPGGAGRTEARGAQPGDEAGAGRPGGPTPPRTPERPTRSPAPRRSR